MSCTNIVHEHPGLVSTSLITVLTSRTQMSHRSLRGHVWVTNRKRNWSQHEARSQPAVISGHHTEPEKERQAEKSEPPGRPDLCSGLSDLEAFNSCDRFRQIFYQGSWKREHHRQGAADGLSALIGFTEVSSKATTQQETKQLVLQINRNDLSQEIKSRSWDLVGFRCTDRNLFYLNVIRLNCELSRIWGQSIVSGGTWSSCSDLLWSLKS